MSGKKAGMLAGGSWEWRCFYNTCTHGYPNFLKSKTPVSTSPEKRTDTYFDFGVAQIGAKLRGNTNLEIKICVKADDECPGLEKWKKYIVGGKSVDEVRSQAQELFGAQLSTPKSVSPLLYFMFVTDTAKVEVSKSRYKFLLKHHGVLEQTDLRVVVHGDCPRVSYWRSFAVEGGKRKHIMKNVKQLMYPTEASAWLMGYAGFLTKITAGYQPTPTFSTSLSENDPPVAILQVAVFVTPAVFKRSIRHPSVFWP